MGLDSDSYALGKIGELNNTLMAETMDSVVPRVLFLDTDPSTISRVRVEDSANLFDPEFLVSG